MSKEFCLAQEYYNQIDEREKLRIEEQFNSITSAIKLNIDENVMEFTYETPIFDEVREKLSKEGFNVEVKLLHNGSVWYLITIKDEFKKRIYPCDEE